MNPVSVTLFAKARDLSKARSMCRNGGGAGTQVLIAGKWDRVPATAFLHSCRQFGETEGV